MEEWQRDILDMMRAEAYYFAAQKMTKVMNEAGPVSTRKRRYSPPTGSFRCGKWSTTTRPSPTAKPLATSTTPISFRITTP